MNNAGEIWAVEWDPESKVPHIQLLKDTIVGNLRSIKSYDEKRLIPGYLLVGIASTLDDAGAIAERIGREFGSS